MDGMGRNATNCRLLKGPSTQRLEICFSRGVGLKEDAVALLVWEAKAQQDTS